VNLDNDFSDQSFVLSFNQINSTSKLKIKSKSSDELKITNKNKLQNKYIFTNKDNPNQSVYSDDYLKYLKERGLALPMKREYRQRAIF